MYITYVTLGKYLKIMYYVYIYIYKLYVYINKLL